MNTQQSPAVLNIMKFILARSSPGAIARGTRYNARFVRAVLNGKVPMPPDLRFPISRAFVQTILESSDEYQIGCSIVMDLEKKCGLKRKTA